jgi:hypothetical protein
MCSAASSIGKGPSIQRPLSGHGRHGRTRCCPAPVAIGPAADIQSGHSGGWALLEGEDTLPIILHIDDGPFILGSGIQGFVEATE